MVTKKKSRHLMRILLLRPLHLLPLLLQISQVVVSRLHFNRAMEKLEQGRNETNADRESPARHTTLCMQSPAFLYPELFIQSSQKEGDFNNHRKERKLTTPRRIRKEGETSVYTEKFKEVIADKEMTAVFAQVLWRQYDSCMLQMEFFVDSPLLDREQENDVLKLGRKALGKGTQRGKKKV